MDKKDEMIKMMGRNAKVWVYLSWNLKQAMPKLNANLKYVGANVISPPFHLDLSV